MASAVITAAAGAVTSPVATTITTVASVAVFHDGNRSNLHRREIERRFHLLSPPFLYP